MEIFQLHYFKTVAQYESFTAAAQQLHITQSALSKSIASLEEELGFQLFQRVGNRIHLNSNGRFFLGHVKEILNTLEHTVEETRSMAGMERGVIRLAVSETVFIKHILHRFILEHPDVHIHCQVLSDDQIRTSLEEGDINFAITRNPISSPTLTWSRIFTDRMLVMLPEGHPLSDRPYLHLNQLSKEHYIISNIGYRMRSEVIDLCSRAGFEPYITYEGHGEDLAGILVSEGMGIMLAPYTISKGVMELQLKEGTGARQGIPIADDFAVMDIGIAARFGQFQSEASQELCRQIMDYFSNLEPCTVPTAAGQ